MKKILICGQKGGEGKSFIARTLALYLQNKGFRVLLTDFDPQGTTQAWCKLRSKNVTLPEAQQLAYVNFADCFENLEQLDSAYDYLVADTAGDFRSVLPYFNKFDLALSPIQPQPSSFLTIRYMLQYLKVFNETNSVTSKTHLTFIFNRCPLQRYKSNIFKLEEHRNNIQVLFSIFKDVLPLSLCDKIILSSSLYSDFGFEEGKNILDYKSKATFEKREDLISLYDSLDFNIEKN